MNIKKYLVLSSVALALTACGGSDSPNTGSFSLSLTDAPIDGATAVWVDFTGIELHGPNGAVSFDAADKIDLLSLQGNKSELLASLTDLEAGNYQWMRLKVNAERGVMDSFISFDAGDESLYVPSGAQSGLKLNRPFVIAAGGRTDFTIDFDLKKSVHKPQGTNSDYVLRPTLRVVNNLEVATITGTVSADTLTANDCTADNAAVYLFDGVSLEPANVDHIDDIDGLNAEPVTSATVTFSETDPVTGSYEIGFVQAGLDYTVALTCTADLDDPDVDNADVVFIDQAEVSVVADTVSTADF